MFLGNLKVKKKQQQYNLIF